MDFAQTKEGRRLGDALNSEMQRERVHRWRDCRKAGRRGAEAEAGHEIFYVNITCLGLRLREVTYPNCWEDTSSETFDRVSLRFK